MSRLHKFPLLTKAEVANSPSRLDGVPEAMEQRRRKLAAQHMLSISHKFAMSISTWAIAVTFFNRFYARKSMKTNNSFIIACAALFLAGKVEDDAHPHGPQANELLKLWFGKDNPDMREQWAQAQRHPGQPNLWTRMHAAVLEAERALLYTLGFDFNIDVIHTHVARLLKRQRFKYLEENRRFQDLIIRFANDIYTKDGTLVLEYPCDKIALAIYYYVFKAAKAAKNSAFAQPAPGAAGVHWYVEEGLSTAECVELTSRFSERLYSKQVAAAQQQQGGTGPAAPGAGRPAASAAATAGAASTAMLGACDSAAYSGAPGARGTTTAPGRGFSMLASADVLGEHTSVPRPLSSDLGSGAATGGGAPSGACGGTKRPAGGPLLATGSPTSKRVYIPPAVPHARAAAATSTEATSKAMHGGAMPHAAISPPSAGHAPPTVTPGEAAAAASPLFLRKGAPDAAATAAPRQANQPLQAGPVAGAAAAAADSDKEEGELEEGELQ